MNLGAAARDQPGLTGSDNRNLAGFDTVSSNPIEAGGQAAYAKNPIPRDPGQRLQGQRRPALRQRRDHTTRSRRRCRAAPPRYLLNEQTVLRGGIGLFSYDYFFDNINQTGFSQATPVLTTQRQRHHLHRRQPDQPDPERPAHPAHGSSASDGLGPASRPSPARAEPAATTRASPTARRPYYTRWQIGTAARLRGGLRGRVHLRRARRARTSRWSHDINNIPMQYLSTLALAATPSNEAYLSARTCRTRSPGSCRAAPSTARPCSGSSCCGRSRSSGTFGIEEYAGSDSYNAGTGADREAVPGRQLLDARSTPTRTLRDKLNFLNPADGELEDRISPNDRPHRLLDRRHAAAAVRQGREVGRRLERAASMALLGGWQLSGTYQYQIGLPARVRQQHLLRPGVRRPDEPRGPTSAEGNGAGIAGLDAPGVGHSRASTSTTPRCRPTAWTTR